MTQIPYGRIWTHTHTYGYTQESGPGTKLAAKRPGSRPPVFGEGLAGGPRCVSVCMHMCPYVIYIYIHIYIYIY